MPKIFVMLVMFLYCTFLGFSRGNRLECRAGSLKMLLDDCRMLSLHLQHKRIALHQLLKESAAKDNWLFSRIAVRIGEGYLPNEAFQLSIEEGKQQGNRAILSLEEVDLRCLFTFFSTLGSLDMESQCKQADCLAGELELLLIAAQERGNRQGRLCRSLGIMGGMACAILLI